MLEQTPTQPLRILIPHEADEVMYYVLQKYRSAHRVELHNGIHYITVTDEAVAVILDRLRRECGISDREPAEKTLLVAEQLHSSSGVFGTIKKPAFGDAGQHTEVQITINNYTSVN